MHEYRTQQHAKIWRGCWFSAEKKRIFTDSVPRTYARNDQALKSRRCGQQTQKITVWRQGHIPAEAAAVYEKEKFETLGTCIYGLLSSTHVCMCTSQGNKRNSWHMLSCMSICLSLTLQTAGNLLLSAFRANSMHSQTWATCRKSKILVYK